VEHKLDGKKSRDIVAEQAGESREQVRRYIRLTQLAPPLLDMVDEGKIAMRPAVELSYLPENEQSTLHETMEMEDCTPSHAQAIKMRKFSEEGKLNEDVILSIMQEEKPNQKEQVRIPRDRISKYFSPGTPAKTIEDTIIKALELYRKRQRDTE
jgi:ParB family chromosome partitioning protein